MADKGLALPSGTGLSQVEPVPVSPADAASIPSAVWLIWATEGEYSDRSEWPVAAAMDQMTAEAATVRIGELWRELIDIYKRRETELEDAGDYMGETLFDTTPEGLEYKSLTGAGGYLGGCYADDRSFTCCEVRVLPASAMSARSGEDAGLAPQDASAVGDSRDAKPKDHPHGQ